MTTMTEKGVSTHVHRIYIKASPEKIWEAITDPKWTQQYGYRSIAEYELRPGGKYLGHAPEEMQAMGMPETVVDGEVLEADPPRRLVQTWRFLWDDDIKAEGPGRVTFEIDEDDGGLTRLTVTHELENAPLHDAQLQGDNRLQQGGGGWPWILSDLKTLLETGKPSWS